MKRIVSMRGSQQYQKPTPSPAPTYYQNADNTPARSLKNMLCELGGQTHGEYCRSCESACEYGRRYVELIAGRRRLQAYMETGDLLGEWPDVPTAVREMGYADDKAILRSLSRKKPENGLLWAWKEKK